MFILRMVTGNPVHAAGLIVLPRPDDTGSAPQQELNPLGSRSLSLLSPHPPGSLLSWSSLLLQEQCGSTALSVPPGSAQPPTPMLWEEICGQVLVTGSHLTHYVPGTEERREWVFPVHPCQVLHSPD